MLSLRHLKAMVLIVGLLTIGLGLYVGFQSKEVKADCSRSLTVHRISAITHDLTDDGYTGNERWSQPTTCYVCAGFYPPSVHREAEYEWEYTITNQWKHRYWWGSWDYCHTHTLSYTDTDWLVVPCNQWGS